MLMPPQDPFPYFSAPVNGYVYQIPSSMLQNTVPKVYCADTVNALQWFKNNADSGGVLLTHRAFYGWAMLNVNADQIVLYEFDNPANSAKTDGSRRSKQNIFDLVGKWERLVWTIYNVLFI